MGRRKVESDFVVYVDERDVEVVRARVPAELRERLRRAVTRPEGRP